MFLMMFIMKTVWKLPHELLRISSLLSGLGHFCRCFQLFLFLSTFWLLYVRWYLQFSCLPCTWVHDSLGWQGGIVILNQNSVKISELLFFDSLIGSLTSLSSFSVSSSCSSSGASAIVTLLISSLSLSSMVLQNSKLLSPSLSLSINLQLKKILHHCPTHHKTVAVNLAAHVLMNTSV